MTMILDGTNGAFLPTWTTATRPASPANGEIGYNSTTGQLDQYVSGAWSSVPTAGASQATATALGTVYAKQTTGGGTPFLTAFGYNAGVSTTAANNTAIGTEALYTNNTGDSSVAVGYRALYATNGAYSNTAVGAQALLALTSGNANTAIGQAALQSNTTSNYNVAIGYLASNYQTGGYNIGIGVQALNGASGTSTGTNNTAIGYQAAYSVTSGYALTAIGQEAMRLNTSGLNNTAIGLQALYSNTTSSDCTAVGQGALYASTGSQNTAVGRLALYNNNTASYNTAVGYQALYTNTASGSLTAVGYKAGYACTGNESVFIGYLAGQSVSSGSANVLVGPYAGYYQNPITTGSNNVVLSYAGGLAAGTDTHEIFINTLYNASGKGSSTGFINPNAGGVYQGNNSATWSVASDQRLKKNIVDNNVGLDKVVQIQIRNFEYRTEDEVTDLPKNQAIAKQGVQLGVIAQELQAILPDCVKQESTGVMAVEHDNIMWHMINAIKELNAKVIALETKLGI